MQNQNTCPVEHTTTLILDIDAKSLASMLKMAAKNEMSLNDYIVQQCEKYGPQTYTAAQLSNELERLAKAIQEFSSSSEFTCIELLTSYPGLAWNDLSPSLRKSLGRRFAAMVREGVRNKQGDLLVFSRKEETNRSLYKFQKIS